LEAFLARVEPERVAIYARVSTHDQQTLPMQLEAMRAYGERKGWQIALTVEEVGSGAKTRPRREELLRAARRMEIDVIVVWRLDRWGRSLVDLIATLEELTALKVGFVSLSEALDLTTPSGRAFAGMLAVFAEFERDILRDRVKAGIAQARKDGKPARTTGDDRWEGPGGSESRCERDQQVGNCQAAKHRPHFRAALA
jgi:putative DNA-invertase from lambdoid prophage Rac